MPPLAPNRNPGQGQLRLHVLSVRTVSGPRGSHMQCRVYTWAQIVNYTYTTYRNIVPAVQIGGLSPFANKTNNKRMSSLENWGWCSMYYMHMYMYKLKYVIHANEVMYWVTYANEIMTLPLSLLPMTYM